LTLLKKISLWGWFIYSLNIVI